MAEKKARKLRPEDVGALPQEQMGDVEKLAKALLDNWKQIAGGVALVVVCLLAYALFQLKQKEDNLEANSLYVKAFMEPGEEDEGSEKKLALLEEASSKGTKLQLEMLYVYGEECIRAEKFDKAKEIMTRISTEYSDSEFAGRAADALAFLKENDGDFEGAIKDYEAIKSKFPGTLEALRIPGKVAKLQEKLGNFEMAVKFYKEQVELFPESGAAENAQTALDRLKIKYPQFFPEDEELKELAALEAPIEAPADAISVDDAATADETAAPATEEVAPAVEVPADAAPMEDAPAADAPAEAAETPAPSEAAPAEAPADTTEAPAEASPVEATEAPAAQ